MGDNRWLKNSFVYLIILVAALALFFNYFNNQQNAPDELAVTDVIAKAKAGEVTTIEAQSGNNDIFVTLERGREYAVVTAEITLPPGISYEWTELAYQEKAAGNTATLPQRFHARGSSRRSYSTGITIPRSTRATAIR